MLKSIFNNTSGIFWYGTSIAVASSVPVLLSVVLARILKVPEYGIWTLFVASYGLARPILSFGVGESLRTIFASAEQKNWESKFNGHIKLSIYSSVSFAIFVFILTRIFLFEEPYNLIFLTLAIFAGGSESIMNQAFIAVLYTQGKKKYLQKTTLYVGVTFLACTSAYLLSPTWSGIAFGRALAYFITTFLILHGFGLVLSKEFRGEINRGLVFSGLTHLPFELRAVGVPFLIRYIVERDLSLDSLARFGVASLFGVALFLIFTTLLLSFQARLTLNRDSSTQDFNAYVRKTAIAIVLILVFGALAIYLIAPLILQRLFPPYYWDITNIMPAILIMTIFVCLLDYLQLLLQALNQARIASIGNTMLLGSMALFALFGPKLYDLNRLIWIVCAISILFSLAGVWYIHAQLKLRAQRD